MPNPSLTAEVAGLGRRERRKLEVRNRILDASAQLFDRRGVEGTKVQDICERADVAHKTFFNHFPSKRHLLRALAEYGIDQLVLDIEDVCKAHLSSRERIRRFFRGLADNAAERGPMHRELLTELVHVGHETGGEPEQARKLHQAFRAIVSEGLAQGDISDRHSEETLTEMLLGAFYVLMFSWANLEAYPLREHAEATAEFLADAMVAAGTTPDGEA